MTWLRARALPLAGILCLGGQGILLYAAGVGADAPTLPLPGLFLIFTLGLTLSLALSNRTGSPSASTTNNRSRLFWRALSLLAVAALLGLGLAMLLLGGKAPVQASDYSANLDRSVAQIANLEPELQNWWEQASGALNQELLPVAADSDPNIGAPARGGDLFRRLDQLPELWPVDTGGLPFGAVLWRAGDRVAWTGVVEPLPREGLPTAVVADPEWTRRLTTGREGWILRQMTRLESGLELELQVQLTAGGAAEMAPGVELVVGPVNDPALTMDDSGLLIRQVGFGPGGKGPFAHLLARPESAAARRGVTKARLLMGALLAWAVALLGLTRLCFGTGAGVLALWAGRGLLAGGEALRWVGTAFPDQEFPAAPGSWLSLADPAYFATPFGLGWFASTGDAILTALVIAATVWYVLQRRGLVAGSVAPSDSRPKRPLLGPDLLGGLGLGIVSGGALLALSFLARLLAENANPRLIGTGISLSFLSFWGLQIVLLLLAFSLMALVVCLVAGVQWPRRDHLGPWLGGGVLAGVTALLLVTWGGHDVWWSGRLLAAGVAMGLWFLAPALRAQPHFLRRFAWPMVMLLVVCWNYASLRDVYDAAERSWLQAKGSRITAADPDWSRFLLGSVLNEMIEHDRARSLEGQGQDLWRDEAAWRLYRDSALSDLGYKCYVEVIDEQGRQQSVFALGFMNSLRFELSDLEPWVDMSGGMADDDGGMIFRTARRRYPGGEEEVLIAEATRAGRQGWLRVELPVRSWRITTLHESLVSEAVSGLDGYQPRSEIDRPVMLLLADDEGWLDTGTTGIPGPESDDDLAALRRGEKDWVEINAGGDSWLCMWKALPPEFARRQGEGFLLGLRRSDWRENVLDVSRLMLLDLVLFFLFYVAVQLRRWLLGVGTESGHTWRPGFQERFLAGYLVLGLVLLVLVGMSVDQVGYQRVRAEARSRTRDGLVRTVEQLRTLLTEKASSLVDSEYIDELMRGGEVGQRPAGSNDLQGGMVFTAEGELLLDETLSDLSDVEARELLKAARNSPMVVVREYGETLVGVVIPIRLQDWMTPTNGAENEVGHGQTNTNGFFFYRQLLGKGLLGSLAELVGGQIILDVAGEPLLASHPAAVFAGEVPLLADPDKMMPILDHGHGVSVFAAQGRPFAFTAGRPLISLTRNVLDELVVETHPAVLNLAFPDREREYANQRNQTILFLAGLANLILLTALLLALLMSWNIFRPLRLLLTATQSLAQGDFEAPLPEASQDEVGRLAGAFGSMRGELQSARDDLAAREQFLATVLGRVTVGVAVIDAEDQVLVLNPAGAHILTDFRPEVDEKRGVIRMMREFRDLGHGRDRAAGELVSRDGRRTVRGALAPLELPDGRTDTMLVFEDITEFLTTKKMAINAELARQVAHEIKNPLTPIQLSVQLLSQAWQDKHPQLDRIVPDTVERVLQQVTLLRSIATEFSLLGRPGELETEVVDLLKLVRDVTGAYASGESPEGAMHTVQIESEALPPVLAHQESLQKILGNLMQNSLDAARPEDPLIVKVDWRITPKTLTLVWRDNGSGLPPEVADRLFDPYFSTKSKGTGLGLVICRNLADRMQGSITLGNRPDSPGAVAELTLPRLSNEWAATEQKATR
ncbi:MAG: ATP-binding protein [Candidatus Krumholzibacteria bacterium]|nr:ATP-binding protein [Candidatus Krumholzibacteria bacterium]